VARHAAAAGLSADRVDDAVIAVNELAANAVHHGAGHGHVQQWSDRRLLHSQVSDPGPASPGPASPGPARPDTAAPDDQPPWPARYGHGLWLVGRTADQVVLDHDQSGTNVTVSFAIDSGGTWPA
jgi:anti-sigma regulatory factor (Ser/Thr protein kinase)